MPDITSRKSETDADRRRNKQHFAALAKGLANAENMGEREREIFDKIAASRPTLKNQRHPAASDLFAAPANRPPEPMQTYLARKAAEREPRVLDDFFFGYAYSREGIQDDDFWDNTKAAPAIIDAPFRVVLDPPRMFDRYRGGDPTA